jgi:hypothetical protein
MLLLLRPCRFSDNYTNGNECDTIIVLLKHFLGLSYNKMNTRTYRRKTETRKKTESFTGRRDANEDTLETERGRIRSQAGAATLEVATDRLRDYSDGVAVIVPNAVLGGM